MSPFAITRTAINGFEHIHIHNEIIELSIVPELGGKINSLRDKRTGREWLWRHPRMEYQRVPHGSSYITAGDTGGWDECFPSVAQCEYPSEPWQGAAIKDHGELWSQAATVEIEDHADEINIRTRWQGMALPYAFTRTIKLAAKAASLHADYVAENKSDQPIDFVWCIHPLLAIAPGMELRLPASARFNVAAAFPQDLVALDQKLAYPFAARGLNLPVLPETSAGRAIKIWSDPLRQDSGWAALRAPDGELRMKWDTALLPQIAAWMNLGAWAGDGGAPYFNLGIEPCIGAQDSLADAVKQYNLFARLSPHGSKSWWLALELSA